MRGVNLGGWLVLEPWMTPSLFAGTGAPDEYIYCRDADKARLDALRTHRQQFITKKDFLWLKSHGIEAVRIPVGYWVFGDIDPYIGTVQYLDEAFEWAEETGLKIALSLHGAPGSQNGEMHSGRAGRVGWHTDRRYRDVTLAVIGKLAERYKNSPQLYGIGLLNEPGKQVPKRALKRFYRSAYWLIRETCGDQVRVIFSDRFQPKRWNYVLHPLLYRNTVIDTHQYQIFTAAGKSMPAADHLRYTVSDVPLILNRMRRHHPVIVGEWSAALDPKSLTGLDDGRRQRAQQAYCQAQVQVYDRMDGWFYWSYKTEQGGAWSFRDCHRRGWFKGIGGFL